MEEVDEQEGLFFFFFLCESFVDAAALGLL